MAAPKRKLVAEETNRRADILRAAGRLFAEKGYAATTIRDIAGAVDMQSGSPFYHFRTKHDMLRAVVLEGIGAINAAVAQAAASGKSPRAEAQAEVVMLKDRYEAMWEKALQDLKRAGLIADDSPLARLFLLGALNWTVQWYRPDGGKSVGQIAKQLSSLLLKPVG